MNDFMLIGWRRAFRYPYNENVSEFLGLPLIPHEFQLSEESRNVGINKARFILQEWDKTTNELYTFKLSKEGNMVNTELLFTSLSQLNQFKYFYDTLTGA